MHTWWKTIILPTLYPMVEQRSVVCVRLEFGPWISAWRSSGLKTTPCRGFQTSEYIMKADVTLRNRLKYSRSREVYHCTQTLVQVQKYKQVWVPVCAQTALCEWMCTHTVSWLLAEDRGLVNRSCDAACRRPAVPLLVCRCGQKDDAKQVQPDRWHSREEWKETNGV